MGVVFLAERDDGQFKQRVALKVIRNAIAHRPSLFARFLEERRILAVLEQRTRMKRAIPRVGRASRHRGCAWGPPSHARAREACRR